VEQGMSLSPAVGISAEAGPQVTAQLSQADIDRLAENETLATQRNNTYVSLEPGFIEDVSGNPVQSISVAERALAGAFSADTTKPDLTGFDLDMDTGLMTFTFNEVMRLDSLRRDAISLHNESAQPGESFNLFTEPSP